MKILIIGGNRFFGKHLALNLVREGHQITLLNRGMVEDGLGDQVQRLKADRKSRDSLWHVIRDEKWDIVFDQVCYTASEAEIACEVFESKAKRYIVTSSESIYNDGKNLTEDLFNPKSYKSIKEVLPSENYQEAKRQVECVFSKSSFAEVVIVRPSLVVGVDDYTGRLKWHIDRIASGLPIYFPELNAENDFIRSDQAGMALKVIGLSQYIGAVNCTTQGSIPLKDLVTMCEKAVGRKAILASNMDEENHSPYGVLATKTMNTDLLRSLGAKIESSHIWLEQLIFELASRE